MPIGTASETWEVLRDFIPVIDRADAAESLVTMLVESGFDNIDIKDTFRGDRDIKNALAAYIRDHEVEEYEDDDDDEDDNNYYDDDGDDDWR